MRVVNKLVKRVSVIVSGGQIDGGNAKFRSNKRDVGKRALSSLEALADDILLEVGISTAIKNSVIFPLRSSSMMNLRLSRSLGHWEVSFAYGQGRKF